MAMFKRRKRARVHWMILFSVLLLLVVSSVPVVADSLPEESANQGESFPSSEVDPALMPGGEDLTEATQEAEREEAERGKELESPAAEAEREESEFAYQDADSAAEASDLLRTTFQQELKALDLDPARFLTDATLERSLANEGAVVSDEGETEILDAEVPATVRDEDGEMSKVDLGLEATPEGFEPANPIVDIEIPSSPQDGVGIDNGAITIAQVGADLESRAYLFSEKDVIYPEVQTDTDLLVSPRSTGVELFDQLRSVESPETLRFDLDLPQGAELRANAGAAEVYDEGALKAIISPPHAVDAQGTLVPVAMSVQGSSLVLTVEHRNGDYAYPILVDPDVQNDWVNNAWIFGHRYDVLEDGTFQTNWNNSKLLTNRWCINACWGSGRGLFVSAPSGNYNGGQWAHWTYTPPGETSYLSGYLINPFYRWDTTNQACWSGPHPNPHDYDGLWSPTYGIYYQLYTNRALYTNASIYGNTAQTAKVMVFGMSTGNSSSNPCWRDLYAGGIATYMTDPDWPTLDPISGYPTGWFDDSKNYGVNVSAHDAGLGVSNVRVNIAGKPPAQLKPTDCYGTHDSPCPRDMWGTVLFNGDNFPEGKSVAKVVASDALLRPSGIRTWTAYVDSTPPEVSLSGQLAVATDEEKGDAQDPEKWDELSLPVYNLKIDAEDGSTASDAAMRSGVKNIEVFLDKKTEPEPVPWTAQGCSGPSYSCKKSGAYQLNLNGLAAGKHTLKVVAVDQLDHKRIREIEFEFIPATGMKDEYVMQHFPLPDGKGNEVEGESSGPELAVNVMNGNLVYREKDVDVEGYAADLEVERFYNSQLPESENTEWGDGWSLAQTPALEPEEGPAPKEADLLDESGGLEVDVPLPAEVGKSTFDPALQATITKEADGGYAVTDESGETDATVAFDSEGQAEALRTGTYAKVDYDYEAGELAEIAVKDPASASDLSPAEEEALDYVPPAPSYKSVFGSLGTGNGQFLMSTDVAVAANGNLWVVDRGNNRVQRFSESGTYISAFGAKGTDSGQFRYPSAIAIDPSGNLWVVDRDNHRIQKFSSSGEFIKAVGSLGSGDGQFSNPEGIAADAKGNVYVADTYNRRIQKFNSNGEFLTKFGSNGSGDGQFSRVTSVDVGPGGKIWATDPDLHRVTQFNEAGEYVQKFGSNGTASGQFSQPAGVEVDSRGSVWVADIGNGRIQQFSQAGKYLTHFGTKGSGAGQFNFTAGQGPVVGIAVDNKGGLWATDVGNYRVQKWSVPNYRPSYQSSFGSLGTGDGQLKSPGDVAVDEQGYLWVVDRANNRIQKFDQTGKFIAKYGTLGFGDGQFNRPTSIAIDDSGNIWVADASNNRIQKFNDKGEFIAKFGSFGSGAGQFNDPEGIAADLRGNIYVAEAYNRRVQVFNEAGEFVSKFGSQGTGPGQFGEANALDIGPKGEIWVADWVNNRVSQFNEEGEFIKHFGSQGAGDGQFNHPDAVEVDNKGNVWVGDQSNHRIQLFNQAGEYVTQFGSSGAGAGQFSFTYPMGIAAELDGDIWITDVNNNRIQKWQMPSTAAPKAPEENDPSLQVDISEGLVEGVEGKEAGTHSYAYSGDLPTSHDGPEGETIYAYDSAGRMTKVTLPNGTWAQIAYNATYGRVSKVTVDPAGSEPAKSTNFSYVDEPRSTTVTPEGASAVHYDISADGSVLRWQNVQKPPVFDNIFGSIYFNKEKELPPGAQVLDVQAHSEEGIASIQVVLDGGVIADEMTCNENLETTEVECKTVKNEWVMETENFAPGLLNIEVIIEDRLGEMAAERFWVTIPPPPPPPPDGAPTRPKFSDIAHFREEFGLDIVDPVSDEFERNGRIFDLINAWTEGEPVARASTDRWGVPLRPQDVAELEYREHYLAIDGPLIEQWGQDHTPGTYAGFYIDHRQGGIIRVGFTLSQRPRLESLKQNLPLVASDRIDIFKSRPDRSLGNLYAVSQDFNAAVASHPDLTELLTGGEVDVRGNRFAVGTTNVGPISSFLSSRYGANSAIVAIHDPQQPRQAKTFLEEGVRARHISSHRLFAGDWIRSGLSDGGCTLAFGAYEPTGRKPSGQWLFKNYGLTAGHCWLVDTGVSRGGYEMKDGQKVEANVKIGKVARRSNAINTGGVQVDAAAIALTDTAELPKWVYWNSSYQSQINGAARWRPGQTLCYSGAWGRVHCGPTTDTAVEVRYGKDPLPTMEIEVKTYGECGASGAPVWDPYTGSAVALLIGVQESREGSCKSQPSGPIWVTPILPIEGRTYKSEKEHTDVAQCEREEREEFEEEEPGEEIDNETIEELCDDEGVEEGGEEIETIPVGAAPGVLGAPTMETPKRLHIVDPVR